MSTKTHPYLSVKNWRKYQHYSDRRPPWIKLMRELIDGDNGRAFRDLLTEQEQYQLIRIWLYASGSETFYLSQEGYEIPCVPNDEHKLRIGIRSAKRIPLQKLVQLGFLELVTAQQIASTGASTHASAGASIESVVDVSPPARVSRASLARDARRSEVSEQETSTKAVTAPSNDDDTDTEPDLDETATAQDESLETVQALRPILRAMP